MSWLSSAVKKIKKSYSGSDAEKIVNTVTNPTGGVGNNALNPAIDAMMNQVASVTPVQTSSSTGPSLAAMQPTIGAGPQAPLEQTQLVPGLMQRGAAPGRMGRRQTILTAGQSASKIRARQIGY